MAKNISQDSPCASGPSADAGESSVSNDLLLRSNKYREKQQLLRTFKPLSSHNRSESQNFINLASNEAHSPGTQMAPTPASQEANTPASYEAIDLTNVVSDAPPECRTGFNECFWGK